MSQKNSPHDSHDSGSSGSSPNVYMLRSDKEASDLILFGQLVAKHHRSATVRRASASASLRNKQDSFVKSQDDMNVPVHPLPERGYRRSLDSTYRQSLESISEYKTKSSFSSASLGHSPYRDISDTTCSDCSDMKDEHKTSQESVGYLSWLESIHSNSSAKLVHASSASTNAHMMDVEGKVGEWNNFWLNYSNHGNRCMSNPYLGFSANDDRTGDDVSDCKSTCSTQREFNEKFGSEQVAFTLEEVQEALHCSQRVVDVLQRALKRCDNDEMFFIDRSRLDSYYSQQTISVNEESYKDRSYAYAEQHATPRPPLVAQPSIPQPSHTTSSSCINVLLGSGVADIFKRVINKRRETLTSDEGQSTPRSSFSDWSGSRAGPSNRRT